MWRYAAVARLVYVKSGGLFRWHDKVPYRVRVVLMLFVVGSTADGRLGRGSSSGSGSRLTVGCDAVAVDSPSVVTLWQ